MTCEALCVVSRIPSGTALGFCPQRVLAEPAGKGGGVVHYLRPLELRQQTIVSTYNDSYPYMATRDCQQGWMTKTNCLRCAYH